MRLQFDFIQSKIPTIMVGIFALALLILSNLNRSIYIQEKRPLLPPPVMIEHLTMGYNETMADVLWIRAIQDFSYCDKLIAEKVCQNESWLYKMLDAVTNLSPHFRMPYAFGALALTIIITDVDGATKIFEKGVAAFPNDWQILYRAAYHYLYEVKDKKRAAELLIRAGQNGAPPWVFSLAGRLYSDAGYLELAESLLQEMKESNHDPDIIRRLQSKIDAMKASAPQ